MGFWKSRLLKIWIGKRLPIIEEERSRLLKKSEEFTNPSLEREIEGLDRKIRRLRKLDFYFSEG